MDKFLYISIGLISYVLILFLLRSLGVWRKKKQNGCTNCCPTCNNPLERIRRTRFDYLINYITFQIFDLKKYKCLECQWKGRRWEKPFSNQN